MSYTEIFGFTEEGNVVEIGEVRNAWRGAMAVWNILEKRYLPPYRPSWALPGDGKEHSRTAGASGDVMKEIWRIADSKEVNETDNIVLRSTFDKVIVKRDNFGRLVKAFRAFSGETSLKEQADIIEAAGPEIIAVGWNQTSVSGDTWANFGGYDDDNDESIPYNLKTGKDHWYLFEEGL